MENKISIFGSTGFIGSRFCNLFPEESFRILRGDMSPKSRQILYFISTVHNYNVFTNPHLDIDTNLTVLIDVLESCRRSKKDCEFNFISSWFVYGDTNLPAKETSPCYPKGFYSITKKCAEGIVESYCKTFNIPFRIIRLCNVYGYHDERASKKKNALQYIVEKLKKDEPVDLYHGGEFIRDYMHVDDACRAIKLIMDNASSVNEITNVGSGHPVIFKDLIDMAVKFTGSTSQISHVPPPDFHKIVQVKDMYLDNRKLTSLGFKSQVDLESGIRQLCQT